MLLPYVYNHTCDIYPYTLSLCTGFVSIIYLHVFVTHAQPHSVHTYHTWYLLSILPSYPMELLSQRRVYFNLRKCYIALHWLNIFLISINRNLLCLILDKIMYCHIFLHPQGFCFNGTSLWMFIRIFFCKFKSHLHFFFFWHCSYILPKVRRIFHSQWFFWIPP